MEKLSYVYILSSGMYGTLYIGVTSNLIRRVWQHREGLVDGFTKKYGVKNLISYIEIADPVVTYTPDGAAGQGDT